MGWTYPTFGPSALPDKKILDDVVPTRPVYLVAFDGHSSWANSKALQMAGITRETPPPPNGKIGSLSGNSGHLQGLAICPATMTINRKSTRLNSSHRRISYGVFS